MSQDENAVNDVVVSEPTATESAPVEQQISDDGANAQVSDPNSDDFFDDVDAEVAQKTDEADDTEETASEGPQGRPRDENGRFVKKEDAQENSTQATDQPLTPKSENRFQKLANENKDLRDRLAQVEARKTQVSAEQSLLNEINPETGDYFTPVEAERLARQYANENLQKNLEAETYGLQIQQNQQMLGDEGLKVVEEVPFLRELNADGTRNPEYNPALAADYNRMLGDSLLFEFNGQAYTANTLLQNGINPETQASLVGSYISPYQLAKTLAGATAAVAPQMQAKAQQSIQRMQANADIVPGASQATKTKVDPMMAAFDEEAALL